MDGLTTMRNSIKRVVRAYGLAALVALFFLSAAPAQVQAQMADGSVKFLKYSSSVGLTPGQRVRVTGANFCFSDGSVRTVRAHVKVFDGRGDVLFHTEEVEIPAGGFHSFDISRRDIPLAGETRTGRAQIRLEMTFTGGVSVPTGQAEDSGTSEVTSTVELIDNNTGGTIMALLLPAVQAAREAARK